ncbi:MAG TPA: DUF1697 domain-containing protein [Candidatus Saccharimonadales bacterium]|nr:DUF1697 domain-containing protein [Candidatus Saccharimonadales bacterium]
MKYVALLRGVNVGGKGIIKMSELKDAFSEAGFQNVSTYINSGNILFESDEKSIEKLTQQIDDLLEKQFFIIKSVILSQKEIEQVLEEMPAPWKKDDLRKYIAFVRDGAQPEDVIKEAQLRDGVDAIDKGYRCVYMSTFTRGLTQSGFPKLSTKKIYKEITIRNYTTVKKLADLMNLQ